MKTVEAAFEVNNYICIALREKGIPTNQDRRLELMRELASQFDSCPMFSKVLAHFEKTA